MEDVIKSKKPVPKGLTRIQDRTVEEQFKIRSAGGKAPRDMTNVKIKNRLNRLRERGVTDENCKWLYDMMTDSELASMHILEYIKKLQNLPTDKHNDLNMIVKTTMDWYKIKHGTRENDKKIAMAIAVLTPEQKEFEIERLLE